MSHKPSQLLEEVLSYVDHSGGLSSNVTEDGMIFIQQNVDGKTFRFHMQDLTEVLQRTDADGKGFIQINFTSGHKVLFTDTLVGFKPREVTGLDMSKIPKVVTTPDLISVFEAIEESLSSDQQDHEIEILKKVFQAILTGGEQAGFDLSFERRWLGRLLPTKYRATA
ncbi:MAG: hypothetical protein KF681_17860 [Bdellovibrionaceae bacterium]|nr:hypothetical protein [Pseudobdellovibrionaceae bacterium]